MSPLVTLAQTPPAGSDLWRLGVPAVALIFGAGGTARILVALVVEPLRALLERERDERVAAQEREREAYKITTPAVLASTAALERANGILADVQRSKR